MPDPQRRQQREGPGSIRSVPPTSRRTFLTRSLEASGGLLLLGAAGCGAAGEAPIPEGASAIPPGKDPANFVLHSENPLTLETRRAAFGTSGIVPYELLFVRNNLPMPDASFVDDRNGWELAVEGVANPAVLTLGKLKSLGLEAVVMVLQCSGNGRRFFDHGPSGSKWDAGAAGCVAWSGVPVRTVAEALGGVTRDVRFATGTGGEELPMGIDPAELVVERSIPIEKAMEDALLAWEMNGHPIPLVHGGPLRLIVPGYYGVNQIKYLKRLAFTREETGAAIMRSGYRVRPVAERGGPSQPTMWGMSVKSWINRPSGERTVSPGRVLIDGVAFGGLHPIRRIEVSADAGRSWQDAPLVGPDLGKYAWRQFALHLTLGPGAHTLASRATDAAGNTQPASRLENERGYGNTSWRDHAVTVAVG